MSITISPSMVNIEESIGLRYVYNVTSDSDFCFGLMYLITPARTMWRCSVRSAQLTCRATVKQVDNVFVASPAGHVHPPTVGGAKLAKNINEKVKDNLDM